MCLGAYFDYSARKVLIHKTMVLAAKNPSDITDWGHERRHDRRQESDRHKDRYTDTISV